MDEDLQFVPEFTTETRLGEHGPPTAQYTGAFFPRAKHFTITNGNFKSVTQIHHVAPSAPPDFRLISLGDLNLLNEIGRGDGSGVVRCRQGCASVRKMYSARIPGLQSTITAAVYQGAAAEEQCSAEISRYVELRHPNILQLYGIVNARGLHATVFHDDLIPHTELEDKYRTSHFPILYFWAYMDGEFRVIAFISTGPTELSHFQDVQEYFSSLAGRDLSWPEYNVWIRPSTGHLCLDLTPPESPVPGLALVGSGVRPSGISLLDPPEVTEIITSLSLQGYHVICGLHLHRFHSFSIAADIPIKLGSIRHFPGAEYENSFEIAFAPDSEVEDEGWSTRDTIIENYWNKINYNDEGMSVLENGWIRVNSANVADEYLHQIYSDLSCLLGWLAQANCIFNSLGIRSTFGDYVFTDEVWYRLELMGPIENLPPGYLFLCPLAELQTERPACFRIHNCPAYWSLDPSGAERLSAEEAKTHGFPDIELRTEVFGMSWDTSVYLGIYQFQEAKGFDPYSQDVAIELRLPVLRVSCGRDARFTRLHESDTDVYCFESNGSGSEDFSESGEEDYESANSVVRDGQGIDVDFCDAMRQGEYEDVRPDDEGFSDVSVEYVPRVCQLGSLDIAEMLVPSRTWNIVMCAQFALILHLGAFSLYDYFCS